MTLRSPLILLLLLLVVSATAATPPPASADTTCNHRYDSVYQGVFVKIDLLTPAIEAGMSKGKLQDYELSVSVRLKNRFYPTMEAGCAFGSKTKDDTYQRTRGGFMRFGMDFNGLRKGVDKPHALLVGLRVGTAYQQFDHTDLCEQTITNAQTLTQSRNTYHRWDAWGELAAGCQVQIVSGFYMGWYARLKLLFTRKTNGSDPLPVYVPGFGTRDNFGWGVNYYIGWRF